MAIDNNNSGTSERNAERSPFHLESAASGNRLSEQAFDSMKSMKFDSPTANSGSHADIASMMSNFTLFDSSQQQNQADSGENPSTQNRSMDRSSNPFDPSNPMEQALTQLLTNQEAAMNMAGPPNAATSGDDASAQSSGGSDGSTRSDDVDDSDSSNAPASATLFSQGYR
jgi:hypothetical protein